MKTRYKLLIVVGIMILGVTGLNYYSYNNYMNKQKERIELFFKHNYNNIESITFTETKKNPTGSLNFHGYFNEDKKSNFISKIMPYQKEFESEIIINGSFDDKNFKFGDGRSIPVSEIENIQRKEHRENSEENSSSWFSDSAYTE